MKITIEYNNNNNNILLRTQPGQKPILCMRPPCGTLFKPRCNNYNRGVDTLPPPDLTYGLLGGNTCSSQLGPLRFCTIVMARHRKCLNAKEILYFDIKSYYYYYNRGFRIGYVASMSIKNHGCK